MSLTRRLFLFLAALLFAPLSFAAPVTYTQGLLWKIERAGQAPSYVFGTIHSEDSRVLTLPKPVQTIFDVAKVYVMEAHLKQGNAFIAIGALHLPGEVGVLKLLAQNGYRVSAVY